jgi:hypothetical protein
MTKTLYHVTPRLNVGTIYDHGILVSCHRGRTVGVWMCDGDRLPWAVAHIARHNGCRQCDLSILHVNVNGMALHSVRKGIYVSGEDVPPKRIIDVNYFALGEPE